jgi:hypothetical protein
MSANDDKERHTAVDNDQSRPSAAPHGGIAIANQRPDRRTDEHPEEKDENDDTKAEQQPEASCDEHVTSVARTMRLLFSGGNGEVSLGHSCRLRRLPATPVSILAPRRGNPFECSTSGGDTLHGEPTGQL